MISSKIRKLKKFRKPVKILEKVWIRIITSVSIKTALRMN